jgi:hypothetical protein
MNEVLADLSGQNVLGMPLLIIIGCCVFLVSTTVASLANIQLKLDSKISEVECSCRWIVRRRHMLLAIFLYVSAGVADLTVSGVVPMSIRACFSALNIPINALLARLILNEILSPIQIIGLSIAVVGCCAAMFFSSQGSNDSNTALLDDLFSIRLLVLSLSTLPVYLLCLWRVRRSISAHDETEPSRARLLTLLCATFETSYTATWASLFSKSTSEFVYSVGFLSGWTWASAALMLLTCYGQMHMMRSMMSLFESVICIPPYQIMNTTWLAVFSFIVFREVPRSVPGFILSLLLSFVGIWLIAAPPQVKVKNHEKEILIKEDTRETTAEIEEQQEYTRDEFE